VKKQAIIITNLVSILIILHSVNATHALLYFIIAGQVPGTALYLDSETMMALVLIPGGFLIGRLCSSAFIMLTNVTLNKA